VRLAASATPLIVFPPPTRVRGRPAHSERSCATASTAALSPSPHTAQLAPSSHSTPGTSSQPLLAEIFSGNPRPHYRPSVSTSALAPHQQYRPRATSPYSPSDGHHLSPPVQAVERPSYFAPPPPDSAHGRARSQSIAALEKPSPPVSMSGFGNSRAPGGGGADQHGFRPSSTLPGGGAHFSASLPTTSVVGSPTYGGLEGGGGRDLSPGSGFSRFGPSSASLAPAGGGVDVQSGWRASTSGLSHSFGAGWNDDDLISPTHAHARDRAASAEREGRARFRDQWGAPTTTATTQLSSSASSAGGGGIGMSNMSPFTRDGQRAALAPDFPVSVSVGGIGAGGGPGGLGSGAAAGAFGDGTWGSPSGGAAATLGPGGYRSRREYSLGAVGSGRKRSDSAAWSRSMLKEMDNEDADGDEDVFAPTRSGATSRRHSFAAFDPPSRSTTTHLGFHLPSDVGGHSSSSAAGGGGGGGFGPLVNPGAPASNGWKSGLGSSAINDDDLAADLNSLHLNLEAHAAATANEPSRAPRYAHVGSMPADFPPARSSRTLEHSRSPPPAPASSLAPAVPTAPTTSLPLGSSASTTTTSVTPTAYGQAQPSTSPRATAEPFVPSQSHSAASRFLQSLPAPAPLPPATTNAVATASPGSRFDFGASSQAQRLGQPYQQQQQQQQQPPPHQSRYGGFGGLPPPLPPPTTQHQYYAPLQSGQGPLSPRGLSGLPPPLPPPHMSSPFPAFGQQPSQGLPPPHMPHQHHQQQQQQQMVQPPPGYFNAPPPPPPAPHLPPPPGAPALTAQAQNDMNLGRGVPLHAIPPDAPLCIVGFKAGRKDLFFCEDPSLRLSEGDLVIVEADRGRDVGKYIKSCTVDEVHKFQQQMVELALGQLANPATGANAGVEGLGAALGQQGPGAQANPAQLARMTKECQPKRIYAKAGPADTHALLAKAQDEIKALQLVRSKVAQKGASTLSFSLSFSLSLSLCVVVVERASPDPSFSFARRPPDGDPRRRVAVGPPQAHVLLHGRPACRLPRARARAVPHLEDARVAVRPLSLLALSPLSLRRTDAHALLSTCAGAASTSNSRRSTCSSASTQRPDLLSSSLPLPSLSFHLSLPLCCTIYRRPSLGSPRFVPSLAAYTSSLNGRRLPTRRARRAQASVVVSPSLSLLFCSHYCVDAPFFRPSASTQRSPRVQSIQSFACPSCSASSRLVSCGSL